MIDEGGAARPMNVAGGGARLDGAPLAVSPDGVAVVEARSDAARLEGIAIRLEVFVVEQSVPLVLEIDARDQDPSVEHLLAVKDGRSLGTVRLIPDGEGRWHLGRLAVRAEARGLKVGALLVEALHSLVASRTPAGQDALVLLDAQVRAKGFYERQGYVETTGEVFDDAGIAHVEMGRSVAGRVR